MEHQNKNTTEISEETCAEIALWLINGLGPKTYTHIIQTCGSARSFFEDFKAQKHIRPFLSKLVVAQLAKFDYQDAASKEIKRAEALGTLIVTRSDSRYPGQLHHIDSPPPVLYVRGKTQLLQHSMPIAIVGARNPSHYGIEATKMIASQLSEQDVCVVSGFARGVDTLAHKAVLGNSGATVGVLGCGIDVIYPPSNRDIHRRIITEGLLLSEFPLGTPAKAGNFPRRNRIISGLSRGVLIIEARQKSGTMITANLALQQGKEVWAVPGSIFSPLSEGPNNLIASGATPVRSAEDILDSLGIISPTPPAEQSPPAQPLSELQQQICDFLSTDPIYVDELAAHFGKKSHELFPELLHLELCGYIFQLPGHMYVVGSKKPAQ